MSILASSQNNDERRKRVSTRSEVRAQRTRGGSDVGLRSEYPQRLSNFRGLVRRMERTSGEKRPTANAVQCKPMGLASWKIDYLLLPKLTPRIREDRLV